jgi:hypothetical protein
MEKYHIEKVDTRQEIDIWVVDGALIRKELDAEFTNFGHHFSFSYIPSNEFWLDVETNLDEREFFIIHLFAEWKMQKKGASHREARFLANQKEAAARRKGGDLLNVLGKKSYPLMSRIHKKLLQKIGDLSVWQVSGRLVRSVFDLDFTAGGHDYVYSYVPDNEIWIDDDVSDAELLYVVLHELSERRFMSKGMNYDWDNFIPYGSEFMRVHDDAHYRSSAIEQKARNDAAYLKKKLKFVGWR